jgi:hypothetical protein
MKDLLYPIRLFHMSAASRERTNLLEESSTDGCGISENEVESTQNNNSSQV